MFEQKRSPEATAISADADVHIPHNIIDTKSPEAEQPLTAAVASEADPIDDIVRHAQIDPGAPFSLAALDLLLMLKSEDRQRFEKVRAQLKRARVRVVELDRAIAQADGDDGRRLIQADVLVRLADAETILFHTRDRVAYADVTVNGIPETWPVRSTNFRLWLTEQYYARHETAPNAEALQSAIGTLEARANFAAPEQPVFVRVGELDGLHYIDLAERFRRVVVVDDEGWRVVSEPEARFRRLDSMLPLPEPIGGGSINLLRKHLNVATDDDFVLVVGWLLGCLRSRGPYPVLVLQGEQGSAKSTFSRMLKALIDPTIAPLRALPSDDRDVFVTANNCHLLVYDNVSRVPPWLSDTLCRLATGGGFATRRLFTDAEEAIFDGVKPMILNGITDFVDRPDLADRAIFVALQPIPEERRRPEAEIWAAFNADLPRILGALLDAMVQALKRMQKIRLDRLPRMADFAKWVVAGELAFWPSGTFMAAYDANRDRATADIIESDPVALAVCTLMQTRGPEWAGTASELLPILSEMTGERTAKSKEWPATPRGLSSRLRRAITPLRATGINLRLGDREGRDRKRLIRINCTQGNRAPEKDDVQPSAASAASAADRNPANINCLPPQEPRTQGRARGVTQHEIVRAIGRDNPLKTQDVTGADGADDSLASCSGGWSARL